jgi:hypothetical protein
MNTLEVNGTAPFMRRRSPSSISGVASVYKSGLLEGLREHAIYAPTGAPRQWAVWGWETGGPSMLVFLGATGVMMVAPHEVPHVTWSYSTLRSLPADLESTYADIDTLKDLDAGWNGYDVAAPKIEAIHEATEWIGQLYDDVSRSGLAWRKPHVAADENGDVTFEWWNGDKGLTIYVTADGNISYLKDWGPDMVDDMEDGPLATSQERRDLWAWFTRQ